MDNSGSSTDDWHGARRCEVEEPVTHYRCQLPAGHTGMHHTTHFLWRDGFVIRHDAVEEAARAER